MAEQMKGRRPGPATPATGTILLTYCAARKAPDPGLLPARVRYLSGRIAGADTAARALGLDFYILSGKFGLIAADAEIPAYDHLLTMPEVPDLAAGASASLRRLQVRQVLFFSRSLAVDPLVEPYREAARRACAAAGAEFVLVELP